MAFSRDKIMIQPTPDELNWNSIITTLISVIGFLIAWFYFVHWYFKNKSKEKEDWIKSVATIAVNAAMEAAFKDVKNDINILFKYREDDRKHIDHKFDTIMTEIRKS